MRDQRLPGDCHPDPGDHATATPPGPADSAARTADAPRARLGVSNQAAFELLRQLRAAESRPPTASHAA